MNKEADWRFYLNSEEAWDAMLSAISNAAESIDIEQYIFLNDEIGKNFFDALIKKSAEGVKIRVLCDELGSFGFSGSKEAKSLIQAGVSLKFFNPLLPWKPHWERLWYFRNHRKLMIVDKSVGFTGSVCLSDEMRQWRESHVEITGSVVSEMQEAFDVMWNKSYRNWRYLFKRKGEDKPFREFRYITSAPLPRKRFMYYELLRAISNAKHYIYLTTPYFFPNLRLMRAIKNAVARGVEIRLLLPKILDSKIASIGSQTFFTEILKHRIRLFRYDRMIHSKTIVVDGRWSTIGSLNLDNMSLRYNFEGNLVSTNKRFTFELEKQFLRDLQASSELTLTAWQSRGWTKKLLEIMVWPLRKFM